jgi:hypothetical protein
LNKQKESERVEAPLFREEGPGDTENQNSDEETLDYGKTPLPDIDVRGE